MVWWCSCIAYTHAPPARLSQPPLRLRGTVIVTWCSSRNSSPRRGKPPLSAFPQVLHDRSRYRGVVFSRYLRRA